MVGDKFTFSWDHYDSDVPNTFKQLWQNQDFADVTLATRDNFQIRAHKVILSASSPIFKNILMENPHNNPLIYFNSLKSAEIQLLLQFIYLGQCEVGQDGLIDFLAAGKELMVNGLAEEKKKYKSQNYGEQTNHNSMNTKEEILCSVKEIEEDHKTDTYVALDMEKSKVITDPIKQEDDINPNTLSSYESSCLLRKDEEISDVSIDDNSLDVGRNIHTLKNEKTSERTYNRVMLEHAHNKSEVFIPLNKASADELAEKLPIFLQIAKTSNGDVFSSNSLKNLFNSIQQTLARRKPPVNLKTDEKFQHIRSVLRSMCARSVELGRGPGVQPVREKSIQCDQCDHLSSCRASLRSHRRDKHRTKKPSLPTEEHIKGDHSCAKCGYKAINYDMLKTHTLYVHSGASFLCDTCEYKSGSPGNVKKHIESEHPNHQLPTNVTMVLPNQ